MKTIIATCLLMALASGERLKRGISGYGYSGLSHAPAISSYAPSAGFISTPPIAAPILYSAPVIHAPISTISHSIGHSSPCGGYGCRSLALPVSHAPIISHAAPISSGCGGYGCGSRPRYVTVERVVHVKKAVTVPRVVHVTKLVSVPKIVTYRKPVGHGWW